MSKKRVHEIAKDLKDNHGIELDNKAMVQQLASLGYDVKSHSSSLEDDQAVEAVKRIVDKLKPKAPPPAVAPKGVVVRRRVGESVQTTTMHASDVKAPAAPPAAVVGAPVAAVAAPAPSAPAVVAATPAPAPEPVISVPADSQTPVATAIPSAPLAAPPPSAPVAVAAAAPAPVAPAPVAAAVVAPPAARPSAPVAR
ncbi:MAG: translation initiation factor IF-2 N-terminal domain-containing protein, partial [Myxococcaceae bacterium]|nr:translation initiation factor IF-2 N-terminal domain-containing protein [Myxococcaceae bacterium]